MENFAEFDENGQMDLPPGFRFHPTDEELISNYLNQKVLDRNFSPKVIAEIDMNKVEPWEMPRRAKLGVKEWYFFCVRDKKYPTGLRTNRATASGYWKATGKDKEIFRGKSLVGMKKTLVFYKGRAPRGEKTNWVIHEYRLEGELSLQNLPQTAKNEWVICRVFYKTSGGKKVHISKLVGLLNNDSTENDFVPTDYLPPLMDSSSYNDRSNSPGSSLSHVHCFSNPIEINQTEEQITNYFNNVSSIYPSSASAANPSDNLPWQGILQNCSAAMQEQEILRLKGLLPNHIIPSSSTVVTVSSLMQISTSQETSLSNEMNTDIASVVSNLDPLSTSAEGSLQMDSLWDY